MPMHDPPHPGDIVREACLRPLGLSVTAAADGLNVSRKTLSMLLNGHAGVSIEMAVRLSKGFGGSPDSWLRKQMLYDLWQARDLPHNIEVARFKRRS